MKHQLVVGVRIANIIGALVKSVKTHVVALELVFQRYRWLAPRRAIDRRATGVVGLRGAQEVAELHQIFIFMELAQVPSQRT